MHAAPSASAAGFRGSTNTPSCSSSSSVAVRARRGAAPVVVVPSSTRRRRLCSLVIPRAQHESDSSDGGVGVGGDVSGGVGGGGGVNGGVIGDIDGSAGQQQLGVRRQLEMTPAGDDTPEQVLRVSRGTSFEGLKTARRLALEAANAPGGPGAPRVAKIEWAFDSFIAQSRDFFTKAIADDPTNAEAQYRLGNFYQTLDKFEDAEGCYRAASKLDPRHIDSMNNLAMILQQRGAIDEAEAYYLRCLNVNDTCVDVMFNWATLKLQHRQDIDACRVLINQIVTLQPDLKDHPLVKALREE